VDSKKPLHYGDIVEYKGNVWQVIDSIFEDGIRKTVIEWGQDEEQRGDNPKIIVVPVAEVELVKNPTVINRARTRTRSATK